MIYARQIPEESETSFEGSLSYESETSIEGADLMVAHQCHVSIIGKIREIIIAVQIPFINQLPDVSETSCEGRDTLVPMPSIQVQSNLSQIWMHQVDREQDLCGDRCVFFGIKFEQVEQGAPWMWVHTPWKRTKMTVLRNNSEIGHIWTILIWQGVGQSWYQCSIRKFSWISMTGHKTKIWLWHQLNMDIDDGTLCKKWAIEKISLNGSKTKTIWKTTQERVQNTILILQKTLKYNATNISRSLMRSSENPFTASDFFSLSLVWGILSIFSSFIVWANFSCVTHEAIEVPNWFGVGVVLRNLIYHQHNRVPVNLSVHNKSNIASITPSTTSHPGHDNSNVASATPSANNTNVASVDPFHN